jgi:hypothetical protein
MQLMINVKRDYVAQRFVERQTATLFDCGTLLPACPLDL